MNGAKVVKDFPKTTTAIADYLKESVLKSGGDSKLMEAQAESINEKTVSFMINMGSPRFLYDFFDYVEIYVSVTPVDKGSIMWATVVGESVDTNDLYFTRGDAEETVFLKAFKICEDELAS